MNTIAVLFICIHNSARSQMAEAFLRNIGGERFRAESAGLEPGRLNPLVVEAMREVGIDIGAQATKSVFELYRQGRTYDYVIAVCDKHAQSRCPIFPGAGNQLHWPFPDPSGLTGSGTEQLAQVRLIRDRIRQTIETWVAEFPARS